MAKGTGRIHVEPIKGLGRCWLSAFRFIGESKAGLKQMRHLDYVRSAAISRVLRKLGVRLGDEKKEGKRETLYLGKPFSFYGSCKRLRRKLVSEIYDLSVSEQPEVTFDCSLESLNNICDKDGSPISETESLHNDNAKQGDDLEDIEIQDEEWVVSNWGRARGYGG